MTQLRPGNRQRAADVREAGGQPGNGPVFYEGAEGPARATLKLRSRRIATTMDQGD